MSVKGGVQLFVNKLTRLKITPDKRPTDGTSIILVKGLFYIYMYTFSMFLAGVKVKIYTAIF